MNDAELKAFTGRTIMTLVEALAAREYGKAETIVTALAKEYGYDAKVVFAEKRD